MRNLEILQQRAEIGNRTKLASRKSFGIPIDSQYGSWKEGSSRCEHSHLRQQNKSSPRSKAHKLQCRSIFVANATAQLRWICHKCTPIRRKAQCARTAFEPSTWNCVWLHKQENTAVHQAALTENIFNHRLFEMLALSHCFKNSVSVSQAAIDVMTPNMHLLLSVVYHLRQKRGHSSFLIMTPRSCM